MAGNHNNDIATLMVYDNATVRVLNIQYNVAMTCDRKCTRLDVMGRDRIALMLPLKDSYSGYKPL